MANVDVHRVLEETAATTSHGESGTDSTTVQSVVGNEYVLLLLELVEFSIKKRCLYFVLIQYFYIPVSDS